jgi:hypothetical protein
MQMSNHALCNSTKHARKARIAVAPYDDDIGPPRFGSPYDFCVVGSLVHEDLGISLGDAGDSLFDGIRHANRDLRLIERIVGVRLGEQCAHRLQERQNMHRGEETAGSCKRSPLPDCLVSRGAQVRRNENAHAVASHCYEDLSMQNPTVRPQHTQSPALSMQSTGLRGGINCARASG